MTFFKTAVDKRDVMALAERAHAARNTHTRIHLGRLTPEGLAALRMMGLRIDQAQETQVYVMDVELVKALLTLEDSA